MYNLKNLLFAFLLANFFFISDVTPKVSTSQAESMDSIVVCDKYYIDRIHINFFHDEYMAPVFDQTIFEDWSSKYKCFVVRSWSINKYIRDKSDANHKKDWVDKYYKYRQRVGQPIVQKDVEDQYRGKINPGLIGWPHKNYKTGYWEYTFFKDDIEITVYSKYAPKFSYTQYDPERLNREIVPDDKRVPLFKDKKIKDESWYNHMQENIRLILGGGR